MTIIEDPLSKPVWPSVEPELQELVLSLLVAPYSRGNSESFKVGYNSTMEAIEKHIRGEANVETLFVARGDLHSAACLPIALASATAKIRLFTLPEGSMLRLGGETVFAMCEGSEELQIQKLIQDVGAAQLDWAYQRAAAITMNANKKKILRSDSSAN